VLAGAARASGIIDKDREGALAQCGPDSSGCITVDVQQLPYIVGAELFEPDIAERLTVGVAMGLSVSHVCGQLLFIEATRSAGQSRLTITGQLGKVMTESVETALSLLRSRFVQSCCQDLQASGGVSSFLHAQTGGVGQPTQDQDPFEGEDIHVHFPAGGIPKDGPSAGVAVVLALASLLFDRPMRSDTAVTGEITLRGQVLPVGGIRDKVLAAHRAGVQHVLLPLANKRNVVEDIPAKTLQNIEVHYVKHIDEALDWAFGEQGTLADVDAAALAQQQQQRLPPGIAAAACSSFSARLHHTVADGAVALPPRARM
jgi:ATP-dependent Lon protease